MPITEQELQMAQIEAEFISTHDIFPEGAAYCVSNPHLTDCPVVYASTTFCAQTGYSLDEITGKNCRFLQCQESDLACIRAMRDVVTTFAEKIPTSAISGNDIPAAKGVTFRIINAKKDGTKFLNLVHMAPLYDKQGNLVRIVGCQYGLGLIFGEAMANVFQGVMLPGDDKAVGKTPDPAVAKKLDIWNNYFNKRIAMATSETPSPREEVIARMELVMAATIQRACSSVDWSKLGKAVSTLNGYQRKRARFMSAENTDTRQTKRGNHSAVEVGA